MKKLLFLFALFVLLSCICYSQNLVPNPCFDDYETCPTGQGQIKNAIGWNSFGYSPDYFHVCNNGGWGIPQNNNGYQIPACGNAYAGIGTYTTNNSNVREYIGAKLLLPLIEGEKYYVSFKVCLSDNPSIVYANNKIGGLFSTISYSVDSFCPPPCMNTLLPPKNFAHVFTDSIITDTANWTTISGSFIADSAYQYIIIGNHFDDYNTSFILLDSNTSYTGSYYIIDDIYVGIDTTVTVEKYDFEKAINIYPNPAIDIININIPYNNSATIEIYNVFGKLVSEKKTSEIDNIIHISDQSSGIYFIKIHVENRFITKKIIINQKT